MGEENAQSSGFLLSRGLDGWGGTSSRAWPLLAVMGSGRKFGSATMRRLGSERGALTSRRLLGFIACLLLAGAVACGGGNDGNAAPSGLKSGSHTEGTQGAQRGRFVVSEGFGTFDGKVGTAGFPASVHVIGRIPGDFITVSIKAKDPDNSGALDVSSCLEADAMAQYLVDMGEAADVTVGRKLLDADIASGDSDTILFHDGVETRPEVGYCDSSASLEVHLAYPVDGTSSLLVVAGEDESTLREPISYSITIRKLDYSCADALAGKDPPEAIIEDLGEKRPGTAAEVARFYGCVRRND